MWRDGINGSHGGVKALIAALAARAVDSLFHRVGGEHAECHRHSGFGGGVRDPLGGLASDVIEMWSLAANHRAQANYGVVTVLARQFGRYQGDFPGARHSHRVDLTGVRARARQRVHGARE